MTLAVKDATGSSINIATGSGDGAGTPFKSPAAAGIGDVADATVSNPASSGSVIALLKGLHTRLTAQLGAALGQTTMSASMPVTIASNQSAVAVTPAATENHLGEVGGNLAITSATITRPANTTQYADGDTVTATSPALLTFASAVRVNSGTGYITNAKLTKNSTVTTDAQFRLHLWKATPSFSVAADNAAFTLLYADTADYLGYIDFTSFATAGSGSDCVVALVVGSGLPFAVTGLSGAQTIKGLLEVKGPYIPTSGEQFTITLTVDEN